MSTATSTTIDLRIVGRRPPGLRWSRYAPVHVGVQRRREVVALVPGDAEEAVFDLPVDVVGDEADLDFRGPFVQGGRGDRFVYLSWGTVGPDGGFELFRRAKLHLSGVVEREAAEAVRAGGRVEGLLDLTDEHGGPVCAAVRPPRVQWRVRPGEGAPTPRRG
jgi:hypothetical protein